MKLGDEFLMSSLFTASEEALARLGLAALPGEGLEVVVGGLGLGYTARTVLRGCAGAGAGGGRVPGAGDRLAPRRPGAAGRAAVRRCALPLRAGRLLRHGGVRRQASIRRNRAGASTPSCSTSTIRPRRCWTRAAAASTSAEGLRALARHLKPGGIFGLWSNDPPDPAFTERLAGVFAEAWAEPVTFDNPLLGRPFTQAVYLARAGQG